VTPQQQLAATIAQAMTEVRHLGGIVAPLITAALKGGVPAEVIDLALQIVEIEAATREALHGGDLTWA
jgi:hypothetical protein